MQNFKLIHIVLLGRKSIAFIIILKEVFEQIRLKASSHPLSPKSYITNHSKTQKLKPPPFVIIHMLCASQGHSADLSGLCWARFQVTCSGQLPPSVTHPHECSEPLICFHGGGRNNRVKTQPYNHIPSLCLCSICQHSLGQSKSRGRSQRQGVRKFPATLSGKVCKVTWQRDMQKSQGKLISCLLLFFFISLPKLELSKKAVDTIMYNEYTSSSHSLSIFYLGFILEVFLS